MTAIFRINLFGEFSMSVDGVPVQGLKSERSRTLVAFLLLHRHAPQTRSHIAVTLWPESTDAAAKANLRRRLHELKQQLPEGDWLQVSKSTLQWNGQSWFECDVADFETVLDQALSSATNSDFQDLIALLEKAVMLYQGDLFPSCYDDWMVPYREQFQQRMMTALDTLITRLAEQNQGRSAIEYAQRMRQMDPLQEPAYCHLMRLYAQEGDRASALRVYHQCMTTLQEELGIDPSPETRELYENILLEKTSSASSSSTRVQPLRAESQSSDLSSAKIATSASDLASHEDWGEAPNIKFFHGRTAELKQLKQWLADDRFCLIALLGIGGIGKTALAAKVAHDLKRDFDYVIWRSLRNAPPIDTLLNDLVPFLSNQKDTICSLSRLMHWLRESRCLVVLDNFETLLQAEERAGQFRDEYDGYRELIEVIGQANHKSCLVLTSREKPAEISTLSGMNFAVQSMQLSGSPEAALALLDARDLQGTPAQKEKLSERCGFSPLAVQIIGGSIRDIFDGDISLFLEEDTLLFNGAKKLLDLQFSRLIPLEKTIMYWLAINRDWTSIAVLMADIYPKCSKRKLLEALESLSWRSLIERRGNTYTQQPVIMEYVTDCLIEQLSDELLSPEPWDVQTIKSSMLCTYALIKTTVKDFLRHSQERLLLQPIAKEISESIPNTRQYIHELFKKLRAVRTQQTNYDSGYGAGNLINLAGALDTDFTGMNLSHLSIRQAYFVKVKLHQVDFTNSQFHNTRFSQPIGPILSVVYSPDGSFLAAGEGSGWIILFETEKYTPVLTLQVSKNWVASLAFSPDGQYLVSQGSDRTIGIWEIATGKSVQTLKGESDFLWAVNFSSQENVFLSAGGSGVVLVWDLDSCQHGPIHRLTGHVQRISTAAFSHSGDRLLSGGADKTLRLWDRHTGAALKTLRCKAAPLSARFSPDDQQVAVGYDNGRIQIWDLQTETVIETLRGHRSWVLSVRFSPCGRYLASGSADSTTKLWDLETGELLRTATQYTSWVWSVAFSPDGHYLAGGSADHTVRLWEMPQKSLLRTLQGYANWTIGVDVHPQEPWVVSASNDYEVRLWNYTTGELVRTFAGHTDWALRVAFSPDGQTLASSSGDYSVKLWDVNTGKCLKTFTGHMASVWSVVFSPDGQRLLSGSFDQSVKLWDVQTGEMIRSMSRRDWVFQVRFSPAGDYVVGAGTNNRIQLWDTESGRRLRILKVPQQVVYAIALSPDGRYLANGGEGTTDVIVWDLKTNTICQTLTGHQANIWALAFSPDGKLLASGSDDQSIKLWQVETGEILVTLTGHLGRINSLVFAPDGKRLFSGSNDETIGVWDISAYTCIKKLRAPRPYEQMKITGIQGLTEAQQSSLLALGAID